jgi:hypothetical protein
MSLGFVRRQSMRSAVIVVALLSATAARAACTIPSSACYPWRIESNEKETVLLEIVPNNAQTSAIYRVCLCPPAKKVSLIFDFEGKRVDLGSVEPKGGSAICRDFRIATARKSQLLLTRPSGADGAIEGCYVTH